MRPDTVLYGVAYYHEYMPYERLDKDIELMKRAGITVVRVGESTWTSWEPRDGEFQFEWMDRVVEKMHAAGIAVVMGTPTYSVPPWLYAKHPEIMVMPLGQVRQAWQFYGPRQNMDITHPVFRQYAERVIRKIAERYAKHPGVIGWQIDNETGAYGTAGPNVQAGFKEWLKKKFGTVENLNKAWGLVYWGQLLGSWDELPPRDGILNPGWKLEWERYQRSLVTDFLGWQARILREYVPPTQWVTQDFHGATRTAVDSWDISKFLDVAAINPYHETQDKLDGWWIAFMGDFTRSMKKAPYLVTETNAQTIGWDAKGQFPPYDGQLRLQAWSHVASGAHMVEYWHWHSLHYGQETYWKGLLGHDLEPNRVYEEATRIGAEFKRVGPQLAGLMPKNRVAILHSVDSHYGLTFMPIGNDTRDERGRPKADYLSVEDQLHAALYRMNVGADFVFAEEPDFTGYDVLLVPPLYVASDALLQKIADFAKAGGHVLLTLRSGFTNEFDTVRWTRMPGPLREACGFSYQEFSTLREPIPLQRRPVRREGGEQGVGLGRHDPAGNGEVARLLRPPVLREVPGDHPERVRQGHGDLRGHDPVGCAPGEGAALRARAGEGGAARRGGAGEGAGARGRVARRPADPLLPELLGRAADLHVRPRGVHGRPHRQARRRRPEPDARAVGPGGDPGVAPSRAVRAQSPPPAPLNWSASSANSTLKLVRLP